MLRNEHQMLYPPGMKFGISSIDVCRTMKMWQDPWIYFSLSVLENNAGSGRLDCYMIYGILSPYVMACEVVGTKSPKPREKSIDLADSHIVFLLVIGVSSVTSSCGYT